MFDCEEFPENAQNTWNPDLFDLDPESCKPHRLRMQLILCSARPDVLPDNTSVLLTKKIGINWFE